MLVCSSSAWESYLDFESLGWVGVLKCLLQLSHGRLGSKSHCEEDILDLSIPGIFVLCPWYFSLQNQTLWILQVIARWHGPQQTLSRRNGECHNAWETPSPCLCKASLACRASACLWIVHHRAISLGGDCRSCGWRGQPTWVIALLNVPIYTLYTLSDLETPKRKKRNNSGKQKQ